MTNAEYKPTYDVEINNMVFKVRLTFSDHPELFYNTVGNESTTIQDVLDCADDGCVSPYSDIVVYVNGAVYYRKDFYTPIVELLNNELRSETVYLHRKNLRVISGEDMQKLKEIRDYLNTILGE